MVSCLIGIVDTLRRRGTSLRSEIAIREDLYAVAVDISSKFRTNKILESWVNALFKLSQNLLSLALL